MNPYDVLKERGFIYQATDEDVLGEERIYDERDHADIDHTQQSNPCCKEGSDFRDLLIADAPSNQTGHCTRQKQ